MDRQPPCSDPTMISRPGPQLLSSERIEVGDLVRVSCDGDVPCDMVLAASSHPNARCYVTTANLDGESSLKVRVVAHSAQRTPLAWERPRAKAVSRAFPQRRDTTSPL